MREETVQQLLKITKPKKFMKDDYICYEGQPGNEMYIVLKGSIGVFITSAIGTLTQAAIIKEGDFFGEMAIFDNLPRSASCIAMEDTVCAAVDKENLQEFLATCPDIAKRMLEKMSGRIRKLDAELYQNNRFVKNRHVPRFAIPPEYVNSHYMKKPYLKPQYLTQYTQACPICGRAITVVDLKRKLLEIRKMDPECRITYFVCDPLWFEVVTCPHCYYTNHYLKFFSVNNFEQEEIQKVLTKEHRSIVEERFIKRSDFDVLVMHYLQAININEHINPDANALIGGLWRSLYWLSKDANDRDFAEYCAKRAIDKLKRAVEENEFFSSLNKSATALSLASIMINCGDYKDVPQYLSVALESTDENIKETAIMVQQQFEKQKK